MTKSHFAESASLPGWLEVPPRSFLEPPVVGTAHELPFNKLEWTDFEKLCVRLVRSEADIQLCRLYGVQGDTQDGIDIFARASGESLFRVYQCKREKEFGPAKISSAVEAFLAGEWKARSRSFYLCTTESLRSKARNDELLKQISTLETEGITLVPWDADALTELLKPKPTLVLEFFGRAWVERFNGPQALNEVVGRLDRNQTARLRGALAKLYFSLFTTHDSTFRFSDPTSESGTNDVTLPDIVETRDAPISEAQEAAPVMDVDERGLRGDVEQRDLARGRWTDEARSSADTWLSRGAARLIVGGPGSGKSTLLRILALDLLSQSPRLQDCATRWGTYLPIWIPFARWTALLAESRAGAVSLLGLLKNWFALHDAEELFHLVQQALENDRLLLLVDGLDEWHSPDAGRTAWGLLETFLAMHHVPAIACARPQAVDVLGTTRWEGGMLAPLTDEQQERVVHEALARQAAADIEPGVIRATTRDCLFELQSRADLNGVARSPMILRLLVHLWQTESDLPATRFAAFRRMAELLVSTQPERRRKAAAVQRDGLPATQLFQSLCHLALHVVEKYPSGTIRTTEASRALEEFLADEEHGLALSKSMARSQSLEVASYATDSAGLLVRHSPTEVAFIHRALLERLAAEALTLRTALERKDFVRRHATNPQMSEVILGLASIVAGREDVQAIVDAIDDATRGDTFEQLRALPLLYELALTAPGCPPRTARSLSLRALRAIETEPYAAPRRALAELAVRGLRVGPLQQMTDEHIMRWFPRRGAYRRALYEAVGAWSAHDDADTILRRGLYEDNAAEARSAAAALTTRAIATPGRTDEVLSLATTSPSPSVRAVLFDALLSKVPDLAQPHLDRIAGATPRIALRLVATRARILSGTASDDDREWLLKNAVGFPHLGYEWQRLIPELLSLGWPGDERIREHCLQALHHGDTMNRDLAYSTLARSHLAGPDVALALARGLERTSFLDREIWPLFVKGRPYADEVCMIMNQILQRDGDIVATHWASLVLRTEPAKQLLIGKLRRGWPHWPARALLVGWGMDDPDVSEALIKLAMEDTAIGAAIAHLLPDIIPQRHDCQARLLQLLERQPLRLDFVVQGLAAIRAADPEPSIAAAIRLAVTRAKPGFAKEGATATLIANWCDDPDVERLALAESDEPQGDTLALAIAGKFSDSVRRQLAARLGAVPQWIRGLIARELGGCAHDRAAEILAHYAHEPDAEVRCQAVMSWCRHLARRETDRIAAIARFQAELKTLGPAMNEARTAAFCGLVCLDEIGVFVSMREEHNGDADEPLRLPSVSFLPNRIFWRCVADHWTALRKALGDDLFPRVLGASDDTDTCWESLAVAAQPRTALADSIVERVLANPPIRIGPGLLRFLQRDGRLHARVRELSLAILAADEDDPMSTETRLTAALSLGYSFAPDTEVAARLGEIAQQNRHWHYAAIALCEGWPNSEHVTRFRESAARRPVPAFARSIFEATNGPMEHVVQEATKGFQFLAQPAELRVAMRFFAKRFRVDDAAFKCALETLEACDREEWVRLVRILSRARPLGILVRDRAREIVSEELKGIAPLIILDPIDLEVRTTGETLVDTIWQEAIIGRH